jgi:superfamily II DNA or RNA helicase
MTYKPYAFQEKDLAKLREHNYTGLLAIQPGGGKTATALFSARDSGASQTLIVAPKSTFNTAWKSTTPNILGVEARVIGNGVKDQRAAMSDLEWGVPGVYLTSPQLFTVSDISMWKPDLLVVDEVHQLNRWFISMLSSSSERHADCIGTLVGPITLSSITSLPPGQKNWRPKPIKFSDQLTSGLKRSKL